MGAVDETTIYRTKRQLKIDIPKANIFGAATCSQLTAVFDGNPAEAFVMEIQRKQLAAIDRSDLAKTIRWVAAEDRDGAGYDVLSFDQSGREKLIDLKTTDGSARTPFLSYTQ